MSAELASALWALAAAFSWGTGDFSGGFLTRKGSVYTVSLVVQVVGMVLLVGAMLILNSPVPPLANMLWGIVAGSIGTFGLIALYQGLATGRMGVVAPVSALLAGFVPVVLGTFTDGLPDALKLVGFVFAFVAVWLIAWTGERFIFDWNELKYPIIAGLSFGVFFIALDRMGSDGLVWPLFVSRSTSTLWLVLALAIFKNERQFPPRNYWGVMLVGGIFDMSGNVFFILSSQMGRIDIAAVISSLYPAATVLLARVLLKEHLHPRQWGGIVAALVAIALISL